MAEHTSSNLGKYATRNPVVQNLLGRYFETLRGLVEPLRPKAILDVGCGEGVTASKLRQMPFEFDYTGIDLSAGAVDFARRSNPGFAFHQGNVMELAGRRAELVLCLEVLEHLDDPEAALERLYDATERHIVVSVPWEPWFRLGNLARGKYLGHLGNHPEHIQQFNPRSIRDQVERRFGEAEVRTCLPWVFVRAEKR